MKNLSRDIVIILFAWFLLTSVGFAQRAGFSGRAGIGGRSGRMGGAAGSFRGGSPRAGIPNRGTGSDPLFNPAPSLSTHEVFNPGGSLSTELILNPTGSLFRPRSGQSNWTGNSRYLRRVVPTTEQLHSLPRTSLRRWVVFGAEQLENELARYLKGPKWGEYLAVDTLQSELKEEKPGALDDKTVDRLQTVLRKYDGLAADEKYRKVNHMIGFHIVRSTLTELLKPEGDGGRERLVHSASALKNRLGQLKDYEHWQKYLAFSDEMFQESPGASESNQMGVEVEQMQTLLSKFEQVTDDEKYRRLAQMPEFLATHENLKVFVKHLKQLEETATPNSDDA